MKNIAVLVLFLVGMVAVGCTQKFENPPINSTPSNVNINRNINTNINANVNSNVNANANSNVKK